MNGDRPTTLFFWAFLVLGSGEALGADAPDARRLAVLPIEAINLRGGERDRYRRSLRRAVQRRRGHRLLDRRRVAGAMRGRAPECAQQVPCLRQVGRALGVRTLLALRVGRLGETTVVQLRAFDVTRSARVGAWEEVLRPGRADMVERAIERMVDRFAPLPKLVSRPWYRRWWVWTIAGGIVAGAVTATVLTLGRDDGPGPDRIITPPPR